MKAFVFAALFYLGLAAIFGILNGTTEIGYFGSFAHTHFNLLGFMAMIVFGIGYFILPRFNGTELRFENWVPIHFYLGNISLLGMVIFRGLQVETGSEVYTGLFIASASLQVFSIFMFITNIWMTLAPKKKLSEKAKAEEDIETVFQQDESTMPNMSVTPETKVSDLVDRLPSLRVVLVDCGLLALEMPGHINKVRQMGITLEMAANNHSLDLDNMIVKIEEELQKNGFTTKPDLDNYNVSQPISENDELNLNILIGDVINKYPDSKDTFQKYFGDGCFDCPGQAYESIDMACRMHSVDPNKFLKELKEALA
jgi:hybrid cluster-associated redox disulfide protein